MSDYGFVHDGKVLTPNQTPGVSPAESDARNKAIEAQELETWAAQPERVLAYYDFPAETNTVLGRPRSYRASFTPNLQTYINQVRPEDPSTAQHAVVKTWPGTVLGRIVQARVYTHNFGGRFVSMRVKGSNGATYAGRASWDHGQCIWLRKVNR